MTSSRAMSFNLGLPTIPGYTKDDEMYRELFRLYSAVRNIVYNYDSVTGAVTPDAAIQGELGTDRISIGGMARFYIEAGEALDYTNTVQINSDGKAYKGTDGNVRGFCSSTAGVSLGGIAEITVLGKYPSFTAGTLTPGTKYYQSATNGVIGAAGTQCLGFAITDQEFFFLPELN
jgi:hypothetical protein